MSAIAALVSSGTLEGAREIVARMNAVQAHRGGEGADVRMLDGAVLGRQLRLYDIPAAHGAGRGETVLGDRTAIAFDGRIFNTTELARELGVRCDPMSSVRDDAIVLRSYERWGRDCVSRLHGNFAFALWDSEKKILLAARDILGEKPLFYHLAPDGELTLASEIKAILRNDRVPRRIDHEAIAQYLFEKAFIQPRTPLVDVLALMPGQRLLWRDGSITLEDFWTVRHDDERITDEGYAIKQYRDTLLGAISERLPRDGSSPGLLYSGGTDSNLLLGMLHRVTDRRIRTYTVIDGMSERDLAYSRRLAQRFGTDHAEIRLGPRRIADNLLDQVWFYNTPGVGAFQAYFSTLAAKEKGTTVAYTGLGVETTLDPPWFISYMSPAERLLSPLRALPESVRTAVYGLSERMLRRAAARCTSRFKLRQTVQMLYSYILFKHGLFPWYGTGYTQKQIESLFSSGIDRTGWVPARETYRELYRACERVGLHERSNCVLLRKGLTINGMPKFEGAAAMNNVLLQFPFLDQKVIEFSLRIPFEFKCRNGFNKYILRENCREFVSDECAELSKQDFAPPFGRWVMGDLRPVVREILSRESIESRGIFDYEKIASVLDELDEGKTALNWIDIWALVTLELWFRLHVDPAPADVSKHSDERLGEMVGRLPVDPH